MNRRRTGFTIVEVIVVIVVIGILAAVGVVAYGNWRSSLTEKQLQSDLTGAASAMESARTENNGYPSSLPPTFTASEDVEISVKAGGGTYCIQASSTKIPGLVYNIKDKKSPTPGGCEAYYTNLVSVAANAMCGTEYGKVYCWGEGNAAGTSNELGNGSPDNALRPTPVSTAIMTGTVTKMVGGNATVCAIAGGKVYCWGSGTYGSLGNGSSTYSLEPVAVDTSVMRGVVTDITMSSSTVCAVAGGRMYCWGSNMSGQLGIGVSTGERTTPVAVSTAVMSGKVSHISNGANHTCAVAGGRLYCWGSGVSIGHGTNTSSSVPVPVNDAFMSGEVTQLVAGFQHTCAVVSSKAYCWGINSYSPTDGGHLGIGSGASALSPTAVNQSVMSGAVTDIQTSGTNTCAIAEGKAYCWGTNTRGQLGDGTTQQAFAPVAVDTSVMKDKVTDISLSGWGACAIASSKVYCWGTGTNGQLGNNAALNSYTPVAVDTSSMDGAVSKIVNKTNYSCAIAAEKIYCWGSNTNGRLGNNTTAQSNVPVMVIPNT